MIQVAIADDHSIFRRGVRHILAEYGRGIVLEAEAASHDELLAVLARQTFDVLILDISMPGSNGLNTLRVVREQYPKMRVIMLSMYPEEQYAVRAIRGGAAGYLAKESAGEQLGEAIERVHAGQHYATPAVVELLTREVTQPLAGPKHSGLSDREFDVFLLLANGRSPKEISEHLALSAKTVSTYRSRVLEKMAMTSNADLTRYALEQGLLGEAAKPA